MKVLIAGIILAALGFSSVQAQSCRDNFAPHGDTYTTTEFFPGVSPTKAIDNLAQAGEASGFWADTQVDRQKGIIRAQNDGAHNGRTQSVTILAHREGKGTRVTYAITLALLQSPGEDFRVAVCRFLENAANS